MKSGYFKLLQFVLLFSWFQAPVFGQELNITPMHPAIADVSRKPGIDLMAQSSGGTDTQVDELDPITLKGPHTIRQAPNVKPLPKGKVGKLWHGFSNLCSSNLPWYNPARDLPAPLDPVFPSTEYIGTAGQIMLGVPDTDPVYPLEAAIWKACPLLKKAHIKVYGWSNPGVEFSTSRRSNYPLSYNITPNRLQMDQLVGRIERVPDTVQRKKVDWGFRVTTLFGMDYRFTTAQGWQPASNELLRHNYLYGFDPVECYGLLYFPKVAKGMMLKIGRYISPPDIEAQLAPDNYLYTHSLMFTVDTYTQTGILASVKLNNQWMVQAGIHAGQDMAPWNVAAIPTGEAFVRWNSKSNNDSIYGGIDSFNNGQFRLSKEVRNSAAINEALNTLGSQFTPPLEFPLAKVPGHDNLQQVNLTWSHRFLKGKIITMTEAYYLWQFNAFTGGTINNGPPRSFAPFTGPGTYIPGNSPAAGFVNYTAFKLSDKDFITIRPVDFLLDVKGERTGFKTTYSSWTVGWTHRFNNLLCIRPEIRYERSLSGVNPYDNGTRRSQFTFGCDLIQRF
jgi:hypothetical protein